ncbi:hypothetical protein ACIRS3_08525 [Streptomyces virginiae]|uniref:hypothetical protein n=1 Tax=Streptomyces virginiae TaxID=1961 RepID=UPI0037F4804E
MGPEGHTRHRPSYRAVALDLDLLGDPGPPVAALPHATTGHGFAPAVTAEQAAAGRAAAERAYAPAVGT